MAEATFPREQAQVLRRSAAPRRQVFVLVPAASNRLRLCAMARHTPEDVELYAVLPPPARTAATVDFASLVRHQAGAVEAARRPDCETLVAGFCIAGLVAIAVAARLGESAARPRVTLIDTRLPEEMRTYSLWQMVMLPDQPEALGSFGSALQRLQTEWSGGDTGWSWARDRLLSALAQADRDDLNHRLADVAATCSPPAPSVLAPQLDEWIDYTFTALSGAAPASAQPARVLLGLGSSRSAAQAQRCVAAWRRHLPAARVDGLHLQHLQMLSSPAVLGAILDASSAE